MAYRVGILLFAIGCGSETGFPAGLPEAGVEAAVSAGGDVLVVTPDAAADAALVSPDSTPDTLPVGLAPAKLAFDRSEATFAAAVGCDPSAPATFRLTNIGGSSSGA